MLTLHSTKYVRTAVAAAAHHGSILKYSSIQVRLFSAIGTESSTKEVVHYEGEFMRRLRRLRRVSFGSTILGLMFLPLSTTLHSGVVPLAGQISIATTILVGSISSSIMLQLVTHPYVTELREINVPNISSSSSSSSLTNDTDLSVEQKRAAAAKVAADVIAGKISKEEASLISKNSQLSKEEVNGRRTFRATRLNYLGNPKYTTFQLSEAGPANHPFASCTITPKSDPKSGGNFYIYHAHINDAAVRAKLTKGAP